MSYNVENLFDTFHDEGKEDFTYLPKWVKKQDPKIYEYCKTLSSRFYRDECFDIDWTPEKLNKKLDSLTSVLQTVANGKGPDILAMQEVENLNVLNHWMKRSLREMGYREVILIEGPDSRGIDGAIISKLPLSGTPKYHDFLSKLSAEEALSGFMSAQAEKLFVGGHGKAKRGILEARFDVGGGRDLTVLSNHWPSQANPSSERNEIAKLLSEVGTKAAAEGRMLISMGDYNTIDTDKPHGINDWVINKKRKVHFLDARAEHNLEAGAHSDILPGSHWYKGEYAALDKILLLEPTAAEMCPDWSSFNVINEEFMMIKASEGPHKLRPKRFDFKTAEGFADHLPITLDLNL
ncbi:MAG TPA: hypothetical protein VM901_08740 [Bdellovibrionota bacterium]|nr:hypothetical protein [Bdellovibrionota bacterium]